MGEPVQDEVGFTNQLEKSLVGGLRQTKPRGNKRKRPTKTEKESMKCAKIEFIATKGDHVAADGGLIVGLKQVLRALQSKEADEGKTKLKAVVICGKRMDEKLSGTIEMLCKHQSVPIYTLVETSPSILGAAIGLRTATVIAFRSAHRPEFLGPLVELNLETMM